MEDKFEGSKPEKLQFALKEARNKRMRSRKIQISLQRKAFLIFLFLVLILLIVIMFSPNFLNFLQNQKQKKLPLKEEVSQINLLNNQNKLIHFNNIL
jgi:cbb3-type cytochrome oxidase subunit 3